MRPENDEVGASEDLRRLGVKGGDVLMVHASMRKVGGDASDLVAAIDEAVGEEGTWMMTLGAEDEWSWVNERPEEEREMLLEGSPAFDKDEIRAERDVGILAEVFRTTKGTVVSDHPEGRFGARGRRANDLMADVPWHDYYGTGSPLERFLQCGGKVLRLGADADTVTLLHFAEWQAPIENKKRVRRHRVVKDESGTPVVRVVDTLDDSNGIADYEGVEDDEFAAILKAYLATGRHRRGTVGGAPSELIDGRDLVEFAVDWIVTHASSAHQRHA
jgi:aminoglycoside N3'-acetyltransferase